MSTKDMDCTVCVSFILLHEGNPDYNREKHATSSRFRMQQNFKELKSSLRVTQGKMC